MDHAVNRQKIENSRNDGGLADFNVGNAQILGHDKGGRPHHRRHELAAGGGRRFNGSGHMGLKPDAFHQGNGQESPW